MPPSYDECEPKSTSRKSGYAIEASSYALFMGAIESKRAKWLSKRLRLSKANIGLPAENVAAIKLLDTWLSTPDVERDEWQEHLERLVEENRL
jgi:hypothetical protein